MYSTLHMQKKGNHVAQITWVFTLAPPLPGSVTKERTILCLSAPINTEDTYFQLIMIFLRWLLKCFKFKIFSDSY